MNIEDSEPNGPLFTRFFSKCGLKTLASYQGNFLGCPSTPCKSSFGSTSLCKLQNGCKRHFLRPHSDHHSDGSQRALCGTGRHMTWFRKVTALNTLLTLHFQRGGGLGVQEGVQSRWTGTVWGRTAALNPCWARNGPGSLMLPASRDGPRRHGHQPCSCLSSPILQLP